MIVDKTKWEIKTFNDVCTIIHGKDHKTVNDPNGKYPIYGSGGMMGRANNFLCNAGTTIIGRKGTINSPIYVNEKFWNIDTAFGLYPNEGVDSKYFYYYCKKFDFTKIQSGAAIPSLTRKDILKQKFIIPCLIEQQGIAKELDSIQAMIDGYKAHISDFDELAKSLFLDTLGDPVINEKKWQIKSLSSLCNKMSTGPFGSMLHKSDYVVEGIPSVNPQNIKGSKVVINGIAKVSYQKAEELSKYYLKENDIILARRGDLSKCAIITPKEQGWLCGTGSFFLHIEEVLPIVFYYQFTSKSIQKQLLEKSIGATMPNLNQGILSKLMIPVPPIDIQQKFASQIEAIEKQKAILCEQLADAEQLMAERMQYYFS